MEAWQKPPPNTDKFKVHYEASIILVAISSTKSVILSKQFPNIYVGSYGLVVFEDIGYIGEVVKALLTSTKVPLIPGIYHSGLWS